MDQTNGGNMIIYFIGKQKQLLQEVEIADDQFDVSSTHYQATLDVKLK